MANVVYTMVNEVDDVRGTLFEGKKFWLAQRVPQRSLFIEQVRANGGEVVPLEKHADIKIVDHMRKEVFPGTHSWKYIQKSISNGALENLEDHEVGPPAGTIRPVGSSVQPSRGKRISFTAEDDRTLWDWVEAARLKGAKVRGNEIYKQLEQVNPRHTYQAWRDRWINHLESRPRPNAVTQRGPPTPPTDQPVRNREHANAKSQRPEPVEDVESSVIFSKGDEDHLLAHGEDICKVLPDNEMEAWQAWAYKYPKASAEEWQDLWEEKVRPLYHRRRRRIAASARSTITSNSTQDSKAETEADVKTRVSPAGADTTRPSQKHVRQEPRSPSYHPESPTSYTTATSFVPGASEDMRLSNLPELSSRKSTSTSVIVRAGDTIERLSSAIAETQDSCQSPKSGVYRSSKRKRDDYEDDVPHSSPIKAMQLPHSKRQRRGSMQESIEIPSTPDRSPLRGIVPFQVQESTRSGVMILNFEREENKHSRSVSLKSVERERLRSGDQGSQPLSEPDYPTRDTQAAFKDPTQYMNFDLPPPEDGWGDEDSIDEELAADPTKDLPDRSTIPDTQALLDGKTQIPDFEIPEPGAQWPPSSPSNVPESSQTRAVENDNGATESQINAELDAWIDEMGAAGHSDEAVEMALKCTTMNTNLAETVLEYFASHRDLPRRMRGVWTEEDDENLQSATDARRIEGLENKHGKEALGARWDFLEAYDSAN